MNCVAQVGYVKSQVNKGYINLPYHKKIVFSSSDSRLELKQ